MEQKKDISLYGTKGGLNKNKSISSVVGKNTTSSGVNKSTTINADMAEDNFNSFINKKTKKLTTAVYMVTSFISDNEPLKWKVRECSVELFTGISNVRNKNVSEVDNVFAGYLVSIDEILSLLEIATMSKIVSDMNYLILKKEYLSLKNIIDSDEYSKEKSGKFIFSEGFFCDNKTAFQSNNEDTILPQDNTLQISNSNSRLPEAITQENKISHSKAQIQSKGQNFSKRHQYQPEQVKDNTMSVRKAIKQNGSKVDRREVILRLFKNKKGKELTIKDISHEMSDCSEKTIQRALVSLVADGALKKFGERRWSKYSFRQ